MLPGNSGLTWWPRAGLQAFLAACAAAGGGWHWLKSCAILQSGGFLKRKLSVKRSFSQSILRQLIAIVAFVVCATLISHTGFASAKRVALVIGNGAYQSVPQLPNPKNDAELVSTTLRKQGFEVVTAIDQSRVGLEQAVERFTRSLDGAEISLFYYSGHGIEVGGENRIIPVDATLNEPQDLETQTYSLQTILLSMQSHSLAQLIYLDACRNNPFKDRAYLSGADDTEKLVGKGLAEQKGAIGSLIAYATSPGNVAQDGTGDNSPFTEAVIRHSFTQDTDVQSALMQVTEEVWQATQQSQRPWVNSTLVKPIFLNGQLLKSLAKNVPPMNKTLAEIQQGEATREVLAGPVTLGAGAQAVLNGQSLDVLPPAKAYKLMQVPIAGTLSVDDVVLAEGTVVDFARFKSLKFEPATDIEALVNEMAPVVVETAAIGGDGSVFPVQFKIQQTVNQCDLLVAEPMDLQGLAKGVELADIDVANALIACQRAVEEHPDTTRYIYLLGRARLAGGDFDAALELIQKAADAGYARAFNQLGLMATEGVGMPKSLALANDFFKQAADKNDPFGLFYYGRNLVKGQGSTAGRKQGIGLLKRAAELGNTAALDELANLYLYGGSIKASPKRAVGYLEASVTRNVKSRSRAKRTILASLPTAASDIGKLYFNGKGLPKDLRQAIKWYERGAERGNEGGAADLSWIFAQGPDDLLNPTKAVWYTSLALSTDQFRGDEELLQRLAALPDEAKRSALRDFVNEVGPCVTETENGLDQTLVSLSRKIWQKRRSVEGLVTASTGGDTFARPDGTRAADELDYWILVNREASDQAYGAYLQHFPNGVFADLAHGRLAGYLEPANNVAEVPTCKPPKREKIKSKEPVKKVEPLKLKQERPVFKRPKPKLEPVLKKPPKQRTPPVKRPRKPQVTIEVVPEIEDEVVEPEVEPPRRKRLPRFPRFKFKVPVQERPCTNNDC